MEKLKELKIKARKELPEDLHSIWLAAVSVSFEEYEKDKDERLLGIAEAKLAELKRNAEDYNQPIKTVEARRYFEELNTEDKEKAKKKLTKKYRDIGIER